MKRRVSLEPIEWRLIVECMQRVRDEANRQINGNGIECSGAARYMTRLCHAEICRLLPIIAAAGAEKEEDR